MPPAGPTEFEAAAAAGHFGCSHLVGVRTLSSRGKGLCPVGDRENMSGIEAIPWAPISWGSHTKFQQQMGLRTPPVGVWFSLSLRKIPLTTWLATVEASQRGWWRRQPSFTCDLGNLSWKCPQESRPVGTLKKLHLNGVNLLHSSPHNTHLIVHSSSFFIF